MTQHQPKHRSWFKVSLLAGAVLGSGGVLSNPPVFDCGGPTCDDILWTVGVSQRRPSCYCNRDRFAGAVYDIVTCSAANWELAARRGLFGACRHPRAGSYRHARPSAFYNLGGYSEGATVYGHTQPFAMGISGVRVQTTAMRPNKFFRRMAPYFKSAIAFGFTLPTTSRLTSWFMDKH